MFLSRPDVLVYLRSKRLRFEPEISEDSVAQVSIDRLLGRRFTKFKDKPGYLPSIQMDPSLARCTMPRDVYYSVENRCSQCSENGGDCLELEAFP